MNTTTELAIQTVGLTKRRGRFVLGPLDLQIPRGFVTGMVGANGSGKTTTLRSLLGLMRPDGGTVTMPAMDRVGVVFDQPFLLPEWSVRDAASAHAGFRRGWDQAHFEALCARFGIDQQARVKNLSRGEGNKLMIALAMGNRPELLILDEPTSGLDPAARADLIDLLREHMRRDEATVLFSTHITSDLEHFADHLVFIDHGGLIYSGALDDLLVEFAYVHGAIDGLTEANIPLIRGLRRGLDSFDGVIRTADSAAFGPAVQIDPPTIEQIVVHHQHREESN